MIELYINSIRKETYFSNVSFQEEERFTFQGDGEGDFEECSDKTTEHCLENHIDDCLNQIKLAQECLKNMEKKDDN
jgi:hypothetical protein